MKKRRKIALLAILLIGVAFLIGFFSHPSDSPKELVVYGNVDIREVDLGFRVFGKVKTLFFEEGDHVQEGALLAELDAGPYEEKLQETKAQVSYAEISLSNAKKQLVRREAAIITSAVSAENYENAIASMQEQEAVLDRALATYASAKTSYEDTKLFAPCNGVLLSRIREPGSVLQPGLPVYTLSLDAPIWVRAYIAEEDLGRVNPGMKALVFTDTPGGHIYEGQVGFISPVAEFTPKTVETADLRTELVYRIRVVIPSPDRGLRQGMPVTVKLIM